MKFATLGIVAALVMSSLAMGTEPTLKASLVDPEKKAMEASATVKVEVSGAKLTDPSLHHGKLIPGEVHIHYRLDDGPIVATPDPKLTWHELSPGKHTFTVNLADNEHHMVGQPQTLTVEVPASGAMNH
jgi:hypothetical protein